MLLSACYPQRSAEKQNEIWKITIIFLSNCSSGLNLKRSDGSILFWWNHFFYFPCTESNHPSVITSTFLTSDSSNLLLIPRRPELLRHLQERVSEWKSFPSPHPWTFLLQCLKAALWHRKRGDLTGGECRSWGVFCCRTIQKQGLQNELHTL